MGLFGRGKDKKAKPLAEQINAEREKVLKALDGCIATFEGYPEGDKDTEDRLYYYKALNMLKLSRDAVRDITIRVNETELDYLENISKNIDIIDRYMFEGVGVVYQDGIYHDGRKGAAVKEIYSIVWNWLHF